MKAVKSAERKTRHPIKDTAIEVATTTTTAIIVAAKAVAVVAAETKFSARMPLMAAGSKEVLVIRQDGVIIMVRKPGEGKKCSKIRPNYVLRRRRAKGVGEIATQHSWVPVLICALPKSEKSVVKMAQ